MYHRVTKENNDPWQLNVSPELFEEHMTIIKEYGKPVKMQEMETRLNYLSFGKKDIVVTFDDGYADNFHNAKPILERHNIPAIFFVVSDSVNKNEGFWWDELEKIILTADALPKSFAMTTEGKEYHWKIIAGKHLSDMCATHAMHPNNSELTDRQLYYALWEILNPLPFKKKKDALKQIALWAGQSLSTQTNYPPLTPQELTVLADSPLFEIGAHTHSHPLLTCLSSEDQEKEIMFGRQNLEKIINRPITRFSYPHGDYSDDTIKLVKRLKFKSACTVSALPVSRGENPFLLPRYTVGNWTGKHFEYLLQKWLTERK